MTKLNIGAGTTEIEGFTAIDRKLGTEAYPLEYADNSVEEIRASHVLEHFDFAEAKVALAEWVRVLKPGGLIKIAVPDFERVSTADNLWAHYVMGGQTDKDDYHKSLYNRERLAAYMQDAGLEMLRTWETNGDVKDLASHPVSLRLQGTKKPPMLQICAIMSIPRLGWNDNWSCVFSALQPFGIPVHHFSGVFWGQAMQRGLEHCIEKGVDLVLCIDYDSMFTKHHVDRLLRDFGDNPTIDALAAMQSKRGGSFPLGGVDGENKKVTLTGKPHPVKTAHFGLTLLRMSRLVDIPKPWFQGQPNDDGVWGEGRVDDDIYFWHKWKEEGRSVYISPNVRIGHLELMVSGFDDKLQFNQMTVDEWKVAHNPHFKKVDKE